MTENQFLEDLSFYQRRLGWARDRVWEVVVTDPIKAVIVSANLKAEVGDN